MYVLSIGKTFIGSGKPEERRFTLLEDVFEKFPKVPINIDIKVDDDLLIKKVSDLITKYSREEYTVWGNFNDIVTRKCYAEVSFLEQRSPKYGPQVGCILPHTLTHEDIWIISGLSKLCHPVQSFFVKLGTILCAMAYHHIIY